MGFEIDQFRLRLFQRALRELGVDLGQKVARVNVLAEPDLQGGELACRARPDVHFVEGLQGSRRKNGAFDIGANHARS